MNRPVSAFAIPIAALVLAGSSSACRQNDDPAGADSLHAEVVADGYRSWMRAPGYEKRVPANSPHSDQVDIFVNDVVESALADTAHPTAWPDGATIVKDGYTQDGKLELTSILQKRGTVWYWAEYDAKGKPLYSGAPAICLDCHKAGSDFVRAFSLP